MEWVAGLLFITVILVLLAGFPVAFTLGGAALLFAGIATAVKRLRPDCRVFGVEPSGGRRGVREGQRRAGRRVLGGLRSARRAFHDLVDHEALGQIGFDRVQRDVDL